MASAAALSRALDRALVLCGAEERRPSNKTMFAAAIASLLLGRVCLGTVGCVREVAAKKREVAQKAEDGDLDAIFELAVGRLQKAQTRSQIEEGRRALDDIGRCADTGCTAAELFLAQQYVKTSAAVMQAAAYEDCALWLADKLRTNGEIFGILTQINARIEHFRDKDALSWRDSWEHDHIDPHGNTQLARLATLVHAELNSSADGLPTCKALSDLILDTSNAPEAETRQLPTSRDFPCFVDPSFPPEHSSLFAAQAPAYLQQMIVSWRRFPISSRVNLEQVATPYTLFAPDGPSPADVNQGFIGTCYFLAALADVAAVANGALIRRLIIDSHASMGLYGVRFYVRGRWITVAVDDHFPVFFRSGRRCDDRLEPLEACFEPISARFTKRRFVGGHAKESSLRVIWPLLMEKAFAKMVGTYDAANGDISLVDCMRYLLGGLTSGLLQRVGELFDDYWDRCLKIWKNGDVIISARMQRVREVQQNLGVEEASENGLHAAHIYSVLNMVQLETSAGPVKLVQLRNPWGQKEWKGDYSDGSELWTAELKTLLAESPGLRTWQEVGHQVADDGIFWMSFKDFSYHFYFEVCNYKCIEPKSTTVRGEWAAGRTTGGRSGILPLACREHEEEAYHKLTNDQIIEQLSAIWYGRVETQDCPGKPYGTCCWQFSKDPSCPEPSDGRLRVSGGLPEDQPACGFFQLERDGKNIPWLRCTFPAHKSLDGFYMFKFSADIGSGGMPRFAELSIGVPKITLGDNIGGVKWDAAKSVIHLSRWQPFAAQPTFPYNPRFKLVVQKGARFFLTLEQEDNRGDKGANGLFPVACLYLVHNNTYKEVMRLTNHQSTAWQLHRVIEGRDREHCSICNERSTANLERVLSGVQSTSTGEDERSFFGLEQTSTSTTAPPAKDETDTKSLGNDETQTFELVVARWEPGQAGKFWLTATAKVGHSDSMLTLEPLESPSQCCAVFGPPMIAMRQYLTCRPIAEPNQQQVEAKNPEVMKNMRDIRQIVVAKLSKHCCTCSCYVGMLIAATIVHQRL